MEKEGQYEKGFFLDFLMGPSIKFVLAIVDAFSNKKNGGQFFSPKKDQTGGGGRGGFGKRPHFFRIFFSATFPYNVCNLYVITQVFVFTPIQ